mgnify:CR=1 FL=1
MLNEMNNQVLKRLNIPKDKSNLIDLGCGVGGTMRFALLPDEGGHYLLVQHIGLAQTIDFVMRKKIVSALQAKDLGLVHEVVRDEDLEMETAKLARQMAEGPQVAMRLLKRTVYNAAEMNWLQSLDDIAGKTAVNDHHPDAEEGIASFREKRAPKFNKWLSEKFS